MTENAEETLDRPFGAESRREMLGAYFASAGLVTSANAWEHVYRLLLWIDNTTGLAHCYESDKAQPGRPWYARSLAFHDFVSQAFAVEPAELATEIDWLFRTGMDRLIRSAERLAASRAAVVAEQRALFDERRFPVPGEDPELEEVIVTALREYLTEAPPPAVMAGLILNIQRYVMQENKRKNLVGEGFEDVLAAVIERASKGSSVQVRTRPLLHDLPGFHEPPGKEKARRVDLAVLSPTGARTLATVKWSVRADREEQFLVDFDTYARLERLGEDFQFTLITNEFDAARLIAACDRRRQNAPLFAEVVHVNPAGPLAAYGAKRRGAALRLDQLIESGRLTSLEEWINSLVSE